MTYVYDNDPVIQEYKKNFYDIYHSKLFPIFEKYEKERISKVKKLCKVVIISSIISLVFGIGFVLFALSKVNSHVSSSMLLTTLVAIGYCFVSAYSIRENFITELKKNCKRHIVKVFEDISWRSHVNLIGNDELERSKLFENYNTRTSDDSFKGSYKGVNFSICETCLQQIEKRGKNKWPKNVFNGVIIKFDFNKSINAKTFVVSKEICGGIKMNIRLYLGLCISFILIQLPILIKIHSLTAVLSEISILAIVGLFFIRFAKPSYKKIAKQLKLEDPEFNKHYRAYSTDQVEGRYLITPAFMERFKHIQTAFGAKGAKCAFYDSHILFALSTNKNLFEIGGLFHSLNDPKQMEEFFNELTSIMRLIDRFKLTEHTGL